MVSPYGLGTTVTATGTQTITSTMIITIVTTATVGLIRSHADSGRHRLRSGGRHWVRTRGLRLRSQGRGRVSLWPGAEFWQFIDQKRSQPIGRGGTGGEWRARPEANLRPLASE